MNIEKQCGARYSDILELTINKLSPKEILRLEFESNYQGFVDIDVLLTDERVFSYLYYYGSCSGYDDWEARNLTDEQISEEMLQEAAIFSSLEEYNTWRQNVKTTMENNDKSHTF